MMRELDADRVASRLAALRSLYVPETDDEARRRLARACPISASAFEAAVARRLAELRALCELADYLHDSVSTPEGRG